jgi:hypothetical protein
VELCAPGMVPKLGMLDATVNKSAGAQVMHQLKKIP